jgi:hypothetical protein
VKKATATSKTSFGDLFGDALKAAAPGAEDKEKK